MQAGTPVVTSRGGATEEVAGGAAVLVVPDLVDRRGARGADRRRDELRALGFARAREFSWDDVAERTLGVYEAARVIVVDADFSAAAGPATRRTSTTCCARSSR